MRNNEMETPQLYIPDGVVRFVVHDKGVSGMRVEGVDRSEVGITVTVLAGVLVSPKTRKG